MSSKSALFVSVASALALGLATPAHADQSSDPLSGGDIIVTARRTEERLQDVPISITVFNQQQISNRNIVVASDLAIYTPSLSVNQRYGPIVSDIDGQGARAFSDELSSAGLASDWIAMDVSQERSVAAASLAVVERHGAPWAVVNNAGIQDRKLIREETVETWDQIQAVNARGPFLVTREFSKAMIAAGAGGRIINIASGVLAGMIVTGTAAYTASKGALAAFTSASALELAPHAITVNAILPGAIPTPGTMQAAGPRPEGPGTRRAVFGFCAPEDIGQAAVFLASPAARMITNQMLSVDGGCSLS